MHRHRRRPARAAPRRSTSSSRPAPTKSCSPTPSTRSSARWRSTSSPTRRCARASTSRPSRANSYRYPLDAGRAATKQPLVMGVGPARSVAHAAGANPRRRRHRRQSPRARGGAGAAWPADPRGALRRGGAQGDAAATTSPSSSWTCRCRGWTASQTVQLLRQRERTRYTPVIFITAFGDISHAARGYGLGAFDFITKPFDSEVVRARVGALTHAVAARAAARDAGGGAAAAGGGVGARARGARRGRRRQPHEGRVPRRRVARAAHAAQRHPRLGRAVGVGRAARRARGARRSRPSRATRACRRG